MTRGGAGCWMEGRAAWGRVGLERCRCGVDALHVGCQLSVWILKAPTGGSWPQSGEEEAGGLGV